MIKAVKELGFTIYFSLSFSKRKLNPSFSYDTDPNAREGRARFLCSEGDSRIQAGELFV